MRVDSDSPCEVVPSHEGPEARKVSTCRGVVCHTAYLDGPVEGEVVLPSRLVLMESSRNPVEEDPFWWAYVSKVTARKNGRGSRR